MLRKRNRPSVVCTFCKRRKVRCDKGNPCSTCAKYGNKECVYGDASPPHAGPDAASELEFLKQKVQMLESSMGPANLSHSDMSRPPDGSTNVSPESIPSSNGYAASPVTYSVDGDFLRRQPRRFMNGGAHWTGMPSDTPLPLTTSVSQALLPRAPPATSNIYATSFGSQFAAPPVAIPPPKQAGLLREHSESRATDAAAVFGKNPFSSYSDTINFSTGYTLVFVRGAVRKAFGPLTWVAHVQTNQPLMHMWLYLRLIEVHQRKVKLLTVEENVQYDNKEREFRERLEEVEGILDEKPLKRYPDPTISATITTKKNPALSSSGVLFCNVATSNIEAIIEAVRQILPKKKIFHGLISRYFQHVYPFFPLVDELTLRENCVRIFTSKSPGSDVFDDIKVERRLDFAHIGLTLLILRFGHLSLISNVAKVKGMPQMSLPEAKMLLEHPVECEAATIAHHCLNQFNICGSVSMPVLQLAIFVRLYQIYGPENGDQGNDLGNHSLLTTAIIQMAQSMGLNREPEASQSPGEDRENALRRKIWYYLLVLDINSALFVGSPLTVGKDMFDTKAPYYVPGVRNVESDALEEMTVSTFCGFDMMWEQLHDLINLIVSIKGTLYVHEFTAKLSQLELNSSFDSKKLMEILKDDTTTLDVFSRVMKLKIYFSCSYFLASIHFRLSSYYENKGEIRLSFFYMKKACLIAVHDILTVHHSITESNTAIFNKSSDIVITPGFISMVHKGITIIMSLRIRTLASLVTIFGQLNTDPSDEASTNLIRLHQRLSILNKLLETCFKRFTNLVAHLSTVFIYAWKMLKIYGFMDEMLRDEDFADRLRRGAAGPLPATYDNDMVSSLIAILESTLSNIGDERRSYNDDLKTRYLTAAKNSPSGSVSSDSIPDSEQIDQMWLQLMSQKNAWMEALNPPRDPDNRTLQEPEYSSFNEYNNLANYDNFEFDGLISSQAGKTDNDKVVNFNIFDTLPMGEMMNRGLN